MELIREKSRDILPTPEERINTVFSVIPDDAEFTNAAGTRAIGISGLPFKAPVCFAITNSEHMCKYLSPYSENDNLFVFGEGVKHFTNDGEKMLDEKTEKILNEIYKRVVCGAGYIDENGAHIIDLKSPKVGLHFDINLLIGNRCDYDDPMLTTPKSAVDSLGRGSFRSGAARQVLASRFTLVPEENGDPVNRQFYIVENGRQIFYSANVHDNVKNAVCKHERNRTTIEYETECGLKITRTVFILPQEDDMPEAVEAQKIVIENLTSTERKIKVVATGMFGLCTPESTMNDIIYASVTWEGGVIRDGNTPVAVVPSPNPKYLAPNKRFATLICDGGFFDGYCTSYSEFIGNGSLNYPEGVNKLTSKKASKIVPFFAMEKTVSIKSGKSAELIELVGMTLAKNGDDAYFLPLLDNLLTKYKKDGELEKSFKKSIEFFDDFCGYVKTNTADSVFDSYVGSNLPFQVYYQSFVSRSFAWTQKAFREIGFREIQDLEAGLYYFISMGKADVVKTMLKSWVTNVCEMGYANHNFYSSGKEPGVCSDDQLWLSQAVYRYVVTTGDVGFLSEKCKICDTGDERSVFETLMKAIEYSGKISVGKHGLPLIDRGDWNDCLKLDADYIDGSEKKRRYLAQLKESGKPYGTPFENDLSESVMNAFLLKLSIDQTSALAKISGRDKEHEYLIRFSEELYRKIQNTCWINGYFIRAFIGGERKYKYLGSAGDGLDCDGIGGTYYLNSFSWSILSDVATEDQISSMLDKVKEHLMTPAGLRLCTSAALERLQVGTSATNYFPGDRENGGVFKHAAMMATCAMLKAAKQVKNEDLAKRLSGLAFDVIGLVVPYRTMQNPYVLCGNPRFCTQYNNSKTGENIGPMLSGTASWLALSTFEMLGISYTDESIVLSPVVPLDKTEFSYTFRTSTAEFNVNIKKPLGFARVSETSRCLFDKTPVPFSIPKSTTGKHNIDISL